MRIRKIAPAVLALALAAGCQKDGAKPQTQKDKAHAQWNSARAGVLYSLAKQQYEAANYDACRKTLGEALSRDAQNPLVRILSAKLYIEQGRLDLAQQDLEAAAALDPKLAEVDYLSGVVHQRWQKPEEALKAYSAAHEKQPTELPYLLAKAETLVSLDRQDEALAILKEKIIYFENSAVIRDAVGQLMVQKGQYAEAAKLLRQASILAPDEVSIREHLALALFYAKDYQESSMIIQRLLNDQRFSQRADLHTALGECHLQLDRAKEARESFEVATQLDPASAKIWLNLAKASLALDDTARAELSVRKASMLEPRSSEVSLLLGYLRLKQNRLEDALTAFVRASTLDAKDTTSLCMCGYVLEKQGRKNEAMKYYAKALKIKPNDDLAAQLMAQVGFDE